MLSKVKTLLAVVATILCCTGVAAQIPFVVPQYQPMNVDLGDVDLGSTLIIQGDEFDFGGDSDSGIGPVVSLSTNSAISYSDNQGLAMGASSESSAEMDPQSGQIVLDNSAIVTNGVDAPDGSVREGDAVTNADARFVVGIDGFMDLSIATFGMSPLSGVESTEFWFAVFDETEDPSEPIWEHGGVSDGMETDFIPLQKGHAYRIYCFTRTKARSDWTDSDFTDDYFQSEMEMLASWNFVRPNRIKPAAWPLVK